MASDTEAKGLDANLIALAQVTEKSRGQMSPRFTIARGQSKATRQFYLANPGPSYQYLLDVVFSFVGYAYRDATTGSASHLLWRHLPNIFSGIRYGSQYKAFLSAQSITAEPYGKPTTSFVEPFYDGIPNPQYTEWMLTVEYGIRPYIIEEWSRVKDYDNVVNTREFNRFVIEEFQPVGEALNLPRGICYFAEGPLIGKPFPEGVAKILPKGKVKWTWVEIPLDCMPWATLKDCIGKYNRGAFNGRYFQYEEGTLLLEDMEIVPTIGIRGDFTFDITYNALYNPKKQYKVFYKTQETGSNDFGFYEIHTKPGVPISSAQPGLRIYDSIDWEALFTPL